MSTDSQHWYYKDGRPCYEVPAKKGGMRSFNLQWDRGLGAVPSVTTVLSVLDKPALTKWRVEQGILAALTMPRIEGEPEPDYIKRILSDSMEQVKEAAAEGTRIHDAIENFFKRKPYPATYTPHVMAVVERLKEIYPDVTDWVSEASFGHHFGFGGKVDLHSPSTGIVVDFKGKDGDFSDGKKLAYDQHYQLSAYNIGLKLPAAPCANIFVSRTHPGKVAHHCWSVEDIEQGGKVFLSALALWKAVKKYDGGWGP